MLSSRNCLWALSMRLLLAASLVAIAGCQRNVYELELKPQQEKIDRKLVAWRESADDKAPKIGSFDAAELARIAQEYGQPVDKGGEVKHEFQREFTGKTPNDIGGSGHYLRWENPLGSLSIYAEEFRGAGNLAADFERRQRGIDKLVDHLLLWLKSEYAQEPRFDAIEKLVDKELRADLHDALAWLWAYGVASRDLSSSAVDASLRLQLFLARRGYVQPNDLPAWRRAIDDCRFDRSERLLALIQRMVATKIGHRTTEPPPAGLAWIVDRPRLEASFNKYLATTPEYLLLLADWEQKRARNDGVRKPLPGDALVQVAMEGVLHGLSLAPNDRLRIKLHAGTQPFVTNGQWTQDSGAIAWSTEIAPRGLEVLAPRLAYAAWTEPNRQAQTKHFGKVLLDGQALASYCLWHRGLTPAEREAWDQFVVALKPTDDLQAKLASFRFSDAPGEEGKAANAPLETPRQLFAPKP